MIDVEYIGEYVEPTTKKTNDSSIGLNSISLSEIDEKNLLNEGLLRATGFQKLIEIAVSHTPRKDFRCVIYLTPEEVETLNEKYHLGVAKKSFLVNLNDEEFEIIAELNDNEGFATTDTVLEELSKYNTTLTTIPEDVNCIRKNDTKRVCLTAFLKKEKLKGTSRIKNIPQKKEIV